MRFDRHFEYDDLMSSSFHQFIKYIEEKYPNDQIIGYRAIKNGAKFNVTVTFVKKQLNNSCGRKAVDEIE